MMTPLRMASRPSKTFGILTTALISTSVGVCLAAPYGKPPAAGSAAAGKTVYAANHCGACHTVAGKGGKSGPDLSAEGGKHDAAWLEAEIKNPKSHNPTGKMPAYADKIRGKDLADLVAYVHSLKK